MNIALIGYGEMGHALARIAHGFGHDVPMIIDRNAAEARVKSVSAKSLAKIDVVIDFSNAEGVMNSVKACIEAGVPLIEGTTGWYDHMDEVKEFVGDKIGFLWSSNFSIGVHMYFRIIKEAARLANRVPEYDIWGHEIHHSGKIDSPSGTAKSLEKILLENIERKESVIEEKLDRKRKDSEIHFSSVRGGLVNFGHTVGFDSPADRIVITHEARNRDGYATGALKAAEWLFEKKGFYTMDDYLRDTLEIARDA